MILPPQQDLKHGVGYPSRLWVRPQHLTHPGKEAARVLAACSVATKWSTR